MDTNAFLEAVDSLVADKHLLKHPFYVLWTEGKLTAADLRQYAVSYYPHVAAFPRYVSAVHAQSPDADLRQELLENLIEEERGETNHPALWRRFAGAMGARSEDLSPEARTSEVHALVETFLDATRNGSVAEGLAALYAYESADSRNRKDEARGSRGVLRHRRRGRCAFLHCARGGGRMAPSGRAGSARSDRRDEGGTRSSARRGDPLSRRPEHGSRRNPPRGPAGRVTAPDGR